MHITPIGYVTFALSLVMLLAGRKWLWVLLLISLPLQAAAIITFHGGDKEAGVNPRSFIMILACFTALPSLIRRKWRPPVRLVPPLILLVCWAVAGAYIIPRLMPGTVVIIKYAPIGSLAYLQISPSNLRHSIYLALNCFTCCCLASDIASYPAAFRRLLVKTFEVSAWGAMVIILWHMLHFYTGFPFPSSFFLSNPGAMLNETGALRPDLRQRSVFVRPSGTFSEPSFAALFVVGLFAFVLACYLYGKREGWRRVGVIFMVFVIVALTSTSGFVAASVIVLGFALLGLVSVNAGTGPILRLAKVGVAVAVVVAAVLAAVPHLRADLGTLYELMVSNKISTDAGGREEMERVALNVFIETYGMGVGLGSNQTNTLWGYTLSNLGIVGAGLLGWFAFIIWRSANWAIRYSREWSLSVRALSAFAFGVTIVGMIGVEILIEPSIWVITGLIVGISVAARNDDVVARRQQQLETLDAAEQAAWEPDPEYAGHPYHGAASGRIDISHSGAAY